MIKVEEFVKDALFRRICLILCSLVYDVEQSYEQQYGMLALPTRLWDLEFADDSASFQIFHPIEPAFSFIAVSRTPSRIDAELR